MSDFDPEVMPTPEQAIEMYHLRPDVENDPALFFKGEKGVVFVVLNGFGPGQMGPAIRRLMPGLIEEHGRPAWVIVCSEAYMRSYEKDEAPKGGHRPGELQERHESGDPTIIEVVIANGFSKDAEFSATQRFERKDGEVVWGEFKEMPADGRVAGAIPDAIRPFFQ